LIPYSRSSNRHASKVGLAARGGSTNGDCLCLASAARRSAALRAAQNVGLWHGVAPQVRQVTIRTPRNSRFSWWRPCCALSQREGVYLLPPIIAFAISSSARRAFTPDSYAALLLLLFGASSPFSAMSFLLKLTANSVVE
jgi:hypothetical protein